MFECRTIFIVRVCAARDNECKHVYNEEKKKKKYTDELVLLLARTYYIINNNIITIMFECRRRRRRSVGRSVNTILYTYERTIKPNRQYFIFTHCAYYVLFRRRFIIYRRRETRALFSCSIHSTSIRNSLTRPPFSPSDCVLNFLSRR